MMVDQHAELDTITSTTGQEVDITEQIAKMFRICDSRDFRDPDRVDFLDWLGWQITSVSGRDALFTVIDTYADQLSPAFAAFLRCRWQAISDQCD
jgi:ferritin